MWWLAIRMHWRVHQRLRGSLLRWWFVIGFTIFHGGMTASLFFTSENNPVLLTWTVAVLLQGALIPLLMDHYRHTRMIRDFLKERENRSVQHPQ